MTLRIGIIRGSDGPADWAERCIQHLAGVSGVELALVLRVDSDGLRSGRPSPPSDVERLRAAQIDILLDLAGVDLAHTAGPTARYGVWSFHHGDGEVYATGPVTRWEAHCGGPVLQVGLIAWLDRAPVVLQEGWFATRKASWQTLATDILAEVAVWPAKVCREATQLGEDPLARGRKARFNAPSVEWRGANLLRRAHRGLADLRGWVRRKGRQWRQDQWAIGIVHAPIHEFLDRPRDYTVTWLPEPSRHQYLADPFAARSSTGSAILAEIFDRRTRQGQLCALDISDGLDPLRVGRPRPILSLPVHLSYPFLFEHEGRVYCIPEMFQSGGLQLFEALEYPTKWRFVETLLAGVPVLDPVLFRHDGRFWILCTHRESSHSARTALHAWWATTLGGPWTPHARNPVKYDARSARPAGTPFEHRGQLYRPGQDCSETYGGAVQLNRITRLTPEEYVEETVVVLRPDPRGRYPAGLHTLSAFGDYTLIDGKRTVWSSPWTSRGIERHPQSADILPALSRLAR